MKHNIIISDLTYMKETCCVAGWNPDYNKMMRLLINGNHWDEKDLKKLRGHSMVRVNTVPVDPKKARDYPHKSEDTYAHLSEGLFCQHIVSNFIKIRKKNSGSK